MATSALEIRGVLDPISEYKNTYLKPYGSLQKNLVKQAANPTSVTATGTTAPTNVTINLSGQSVLMKGPLIVEVTASCTSSGGTFTRFCNGFPIVGQYILRAAGVEIMNVRYANRVRLMESWVNRDANWLNTIGQNTYGFANPVTRITWGTGNVYQLEFDFGGLFSGIDFPLPLLQGIFELQITFVPPSQVLESDGTAASLSYTLSNIQSITNYLAQDQAAVDQLKGLQRSGVISLPFQWIQVDTQQVPANSTSISYNIQTKANSISKFVHWLVVNSDLNDATVSDRYDSYPFSSTSSYQYQVNSQLLPSQPIVNTSSQTFSEGYLQLLYAYDNLSLSDDVTGPLFRGEDYTTDKAFFAYRFSSPYAKDPVNGGLPVLGTGINTALSNSQCNVAFIKSGVNVIYDLYTVSYVDCLLMIYPNGTVSLIK